MKIALWTKQAIQGTLIVLVVVIDCSKKKQQRGEQETNPNKLESAVSSTPLQIDFWPQRHFSLKERFMQSENKYIIYKQIMINALLPPHNFF